MDKRSAYKFLLETADGHRHMQQGNIQWITQEWYVMVWTEFKWLRIGSNHTASFCEYRNKPLSSVEAQNYFITWANINFSPSLYDEATQSVSKTDRQSVSSHIHVMNANIHSNDEGEIWVLW